MDARSELQIARESLASGLDDKLKNIPEWRAIRAIDRALAALPSELPPAAARPGVPVHLPDGSTKRLYPPYTTLARMLIEQKGAPIVTAELVEFVGRNRPLHRDPEKAKINITSSLSKDERFLSVPFEGGRAWWLAGRELPTRAGMLLDKLESNTGKAAP